MRPIEIHRTISLRSLCKVSANSAYRFSRTKQKKVEKNKFLCKLFNPPSQLSRYFEARGKRSTIVTARGTRKAEIRFSLILYANLRHFYHFSIFKAYSFALLFKISQPHSIFLSTQLFKYSFISMFIVMSYFHRNLQENFRAMIIFRPQKNKFLPTLLSAHILRSRYYSKAK